MALNTREASTVEELVENVVEIHAEIGNAHPLWFRGHNCGAPPLLPKIMRSAQDPNAVFDLEGRLLTRFRQRSLPYWPSGYPQTDWEHLFAMQHHGVQTRLLEHDDSFCDGTFHGVATGPDAAAWT